MDSNSNEPNMTLSDSYLNLNPLRYEKLFSENNKQYFWDSGPPMGDFYIYFYIFKKFRKILSEPGLADKGVNIDIHIWTN